MLSESRDVIATRIARAAILSASFALMGCHSMVSHSSNSGWETRSIDTSSMHEISAESFDGALISRLMEDYKRAPLDNDYSDLKLSRILESNVRKNSFFVIFDILYVDDTQVVYEIDGDVIVNKHILSMWK